MIITLTTDFGLASPYVAAMKGVILSLNSGARLVDLGHEIPPQDVRHAAYFLASALPYFPGDTLHVVVVDPGVGTNRSALYVECGGQRILAPDNGCWTLFGQEPARVIRLTEPRFWRPSVSSTFHGRDVFAPVAGHLSLGLDPRELGPATREWARVEQKAPLQAEGSLKGEIVFVDHFGNLISNIGEELLPRDRSGIEVTLSGTKEHKFTQWVRTYGEAHADDLVLLISSAGTLEIARVQGNAARLLGAGVGDAVAVRWSRS
jgi:S-adenosylmethionine hydrolase